MPKVVVPGAFETLELVFSPDSAGAFGASLEIVTTAASAPIRVELKGKGASPDCPVAVAECLEGATITAISTIHLSGASSFSSAGSILDYAWSVVQPVGGTAPLTPNSTAEKVSFEANFVGETVFTLHVVDEMGRKSCVPSSVSVAVTVPEALYVELSWTALSPPEGLADGVGPDLDLHVRHQNAGTPTPVDWFHPFFDAYWDNSGPNWGALDPGVDDDPSLVRDDTDGDGPEALSLATPEADGVYCVGVHFWQDHGAGPVQARVRVFLFSTLVWEQQLLLEEGEFWESACVDWASGAVDASLNEAGGPSIKTDVGIIP